MVIEQSMTFHLFNYKYKDVHYAGNTNLIYYKSLNYQS